MPSKNALRKRRQRQRKRDLDPRIEFWIDPRIERTVRAAIAKAFR